MLMLPLSRTAISGHSRHPNEALKYIYCSSTSLSQPTLVSQLHIQLLKKPLVPNLFCLKMCRYKTNIKEGAYRVPVHLLSVQRLCQIQSTSALVHIEKANGRLISSWTSDAITYRLHFIFTRTDLIKTQQVWVKQLSLTLTIVNILQNHFNLVKKKC